MNKDNRLFNRKELGNYRSGLRKNLTSAEASLWNLLKNRQVSGNKFRRQHSIGNYIVDFCCPQERLIIELDGNIHGESQQIIRDEARDDYLKKLGFTVLRFENRFVFQDPEFVIDEIKKCLTGKHQTPWHSFVVPPLLQKEGRVIFSIYSYIRIIK